MQISLAIDLGAGSGRVMRGVFARGRLTLEEIHRFPNEMHTSGGHLRWNTARILDEIAAGLHKTAETVPFPASLGVDTWGVDFVLLDADGNLIEEPVAYRDARTDGMMESYLERIDRETVYRRTGIQFMPINTLYQLHAVRRRDPDLLSRADRLLMVPDYLNYRLTGRLFSEFTIATTTQMVNAEARTWDPDLVRALQIEPRILPSIAQPGTVAGRLTGVDGLPRVSVILPGTHDTASAVAAIPAQGTDWAFISSGTWCLVGVETTAPLLTREALDLNFTNEGGVFGTYRLLKNLTGLWIVRGIKADFGDAHSFDDLKALGAAAPAFGPLIDPNDPRFTHPESMCAAIDAFCRDTGQTPPRDPGAYVRCALESLVLRYRRTLAELQTLTGHELRRIHMVGGGCRDEWMCQMTADATGLPVMAGPIEAAAIGNLLVQAIALGEFPDLAAARACVADSFSIARYAPGERTGWNAAYGRLQQLRGS